MRPLFGSLIGYLSQLSLVLILEVRASQKPLMLTADPNLRLGPWSTCLTKKSKHEPSGLPSAGKKFSRPLNAISVETSATCILTLTVFWRLDTHDLSDVAEDE